MVKVLTALLAIASFGVWGQTAKPVYISFTGEDQLGKLVAYELREKIARSAGYVLVENAPMIIVRFVSIDPDRSFETAGNRTALAVTITYKWSSDALAEFIEMPIRVQVCGRSKVRECADDIMADVSSVNVPKEHFRRK